MVAGIHREEGADNNQDREDIEGIRSCSRGEEGHSIQEEEQSSRGSGCIEEADFVLGGFQELKSGFDCWD